MPSGDGFSPSARIAQRWNGRNGFSNGNTARAENLPAMAPIVSRDQQSSGLAKVAGWSASHREKCGQMVEPAWPTSTTARRAGRRRLAGLESKTAARHQPVRGKGVRQALGHCRGSHHRTRTAMSGNSFRTGRLARMPTLRPTP